MATLKSLLESPDKSVRLKAALAAGTYPETEYIEILEGIREAVEKEERFRWLMTAAQARIEVWRTEQYSARMEVKATQ